MNEIAVYTCVTGDYDNVVEFYSYKDKEIDYLLFTNNQKIRSDFWKVIYIEDNNLSNVKLARKIKILGHPVLKQYKYTLWLDGASLPRKNLIPFVNSCIESGSHFISFAHRERDCAYQESLAVLYLKKDISAIVKPQMYSYLNEGFPQHNGLIESPVIFRSWDLEVERTMQVWFEQILRHSHRDQLSFNYAAWKTGFEYHLLLADAFDNSFFGRSSHRTVNCNISRFYVHFGEFDPSYHFSIESFDEYFDNEYEKGRSSRFKGEIKVLKNCNIMRIELASIERVKFKNFIVKYSKPVNYTFYNYEKIGNQYIFLNDHPIVVLTGDFHKDDKIKFRIELEPSIVL